MSVDSCPESHHRAELQDCKEKTEVGHFNRMGLCANVGGKKRLQSYKPLPLERLNRVTTLKNDREPTIAASYDPVLLYDLSMACHNAQHRINDRVRPSN